MGSSRHDFIKAECRETERLKLRAWRLNVEVPNDPSWWDDDFEENIEAGMRPEELELLGNRWLSEEGKARLMFRIEDAEIKKEDARIERRNKRVAYYAQIVAMLVGLGGVLMGLIALWRR
jgi:hypothetical protein